MEIAVTPGGRLRSSIAEILAALEPGSGYHIASIDLDITRDAAALAVPCAQPPTASS
jgi:hypothetical protein